MRSLPKSAGFSTNEVLIEIVRTSEGHSSVRTTALSVSILLLLLAVAQLGWSGPIVVPTDLNVGDEYRLAFITQGTTVATSQDISVYNAFVTAEALSVSELSKLGTSWTAMASTADLDLMPGIDARDNTHSNPFTDGTGVPIYLLNDTRVADNYADLWDGSIANEIDITQDGSVRMDEPGELVWTGSTSDGVEFIKINAKGQKASEGLGTQDPDPDFGAFFAFVGNWPATNSTWIAYTADSPLTNLHPLYGISDILTVPHEPEPSPVPEPSTTVMLTLGSIMAVGLKKLFERLYRLSLSRRRGNFVVTL